MSKTSFVAATPDEKAQLLGQEFRNIDVLGFEVTDGVCFTEILLDGEAFILVGDPQEALKTFLGGRANKTQQ
ncbi:hypothetical protein PHO31112_04312 [Pandoraea horticolens]|uniref:Uncharacterized protein n=1 Tax=Pandoraea horticolens TaxID=2508298 RepID=A0A5E4Y653_9BURK|nr:hypothetical protein [Pandoraea horticolens]VVE44161.1 hypothetical protein PHO31112_04312 [Pandoraea horticolens]